MTISETKSNLRGSVFVFAFLCLVSSALYVTADEVSTTHVVVFDDFDTDGLSNNEEKVYGTDPDVADTDGDGYSDGVEIEGGFDPLKPAPGDRIVPQDVTTNDTDASPSINNLTSQATEELAALLESKGSTDQALDEDFSSVINDILSTSQEDVVLPDIDDSELKIKKLPDGLSDEEKEEQIREDTVEYLTLVGYILLSNLPTPVRNEFQLENFVGTSGNAMLASLVSGDFSFLDESERRAKSALDEINGVEIPENMVVTHKKAIQMLTYVSNMKQEVHRYVTPEDPIAQMMAFSKIVGVIVSLHGFTQETQDKLAQYGIQNLSLDL